MLPQAAICWRSSSVWSWRAAATNWFIRFWFSNDWGDVFDQHHPVWRRTGLAIVIVSVLIESEKQQTHSIISRVFEFIYRPPPVSFQKNSDFIVQLYLLDKIKIRIVTISIDFYHNEKKNVVNYRAIKSLPTASGKFSFSSKVHFWEQK